MGGATSVEEFFEQVCKGWETNDAVQVGDQFVADGSLINPFGERADGRVAVTAMYAEYFSGMLAGTSTTIRLESVRPIGESHALADADQKILAPDGTVVLTAHLAALLERAEDQWRFVDVRPYAFADLPS